MESLIAEYRVQGKLDISVEMAAIRPELIDFDWLVIVHLILLFAGLTIVIVIVGKLMGL